MAANADTESGEPGAGRQNEPDPRKAVLIGMSAKGARPAETAESLQELALLAKAAGLEPAASFFQERDTPEPAFRIGRGKAEEIGGLMKQQGISLAVFDDDLAPNQQRNLENLWGCRVIDRTILVLEIFARRARTREGKLQVELAQLSYLLPRLAGKGTLLSRLGGGIGTRGPGETKLEMDRRRIRRRISLLRQDLEKVRQRRSLQRGPRKKIPAATVALVGYTNAGKSTLFNSLCSAGVLVSAGVFSTLDPTVRGITLPDGRRVLLADTVGFLRKLPHHLVAAFQATLEEVVQADLLLHVIDSTADNMPEQIRAVEQVLHELGCAGKRTVYVFNKSDLLDPGRQETRRAFFRTFSCFEETSALCQTGLVELLQKIKEQLGDLRSRIRVLLPFSEASLRAAVHEHGMVLKELFLETGSEIEAMVDSKLRSRLNPFQIRDDRNDPKSG